MPSKNKSVIGGSEYRKWEKTIRDNNKEKSLKVEEAENGFIIRICEYTYEPNWKESIKVYISTTNPLEKEEPKDGPDKEILDAIKEFNEQFN